MYSARACGAVTPATHGSTRAKRGAENSTGA